MGPLFTRSRLAGAALLVLALLLPASAAARGGAADGAREGGMGALRQTLVTALAGSQAGDAVHTLGDSLALLGAKWQIERKARVDAAKAKREAAAGEASATPPPEEELDPEDMPAASAGTNGSYEPGSAPAAKGAVFAHSRAGESSSILLSGIALAPPDAPETVKGVINNANSIVGRPYVWGGGHGSFYSYGYDCSGSVSFALFGGGLIPEPLTSGSLEGWGAPGPGKWITVYANAGHTFAEIAGLRWDTVGDENGTGPRWHLMPTSTAGFVVRHPPGL